MTTRVWFWRLLSRMPSILFDSYKDISKLSVFRTWTFDLVLKNSSRRYLTTQEPLEKNQFQVLLTWSALHMTWGHQWSVRGLIKNFSKLFFAGNTWKSWAGLFGMVHALGMKWIPWETTVISFRLDTLLKIQFLFYIKETKSKHKLFSQRYLKDNLSSTGTVKALEFWYPGPGSGDGSEWTGSKVFQSSRRRF